MSVWNAWKIRTPMAKLYYQATSNPPVDEFVRGIQNKLNAIRRSCNGNWGELAEDGRYGRQTANAVKAFQVYKGLTPVSGMLGPTTMEAIDEAYRNRFAVKVMTTLNAIAPVAKTVGASSDLSSKVFDPSLPWMKHLQASFPEVYRRLRAHEKAPCFVFSKQDAYHKFGQIYKRINGIELNVKAIDYLSNLALVSQWISIASEIDDYKKKISEGNMTGRSWTKLGADAYTLLTGSADAILGILNKKAFSFYTVADTGAAFTLSRLTLLSTIGQAIGAFLLGYEIGNFIREIPGGNGETVGDYIDSYIQEIWDHPYKTLGKMGPSAAPLALLIDAWKKGIEWNVNRVSNLKPMTSYEKRLLEQAKLRNREMYIQAAPPKLVIRAAK